MIAFNALAVVQGFDYPEAIGQALDHSVTIRAWNIKV
jgi:hypothetical protein